MADADQIGCKLEKLKINTWLSIRVYIGNNFNTQFYRCTAFSDRVRNLQTAKCQKYLTELPVKYKVSTTVVATYFMFYIMLQLRW